MKRLFLILGMLGMCMYSTAQIKVDSEGKVDISNTLSVEVPGTSGLFGAPATCGVDLYTNYNSFGTPNDRYFLRGSEYYKYTTIGQQPFSGVTFYVRSDGQIFSKWGALQMSDGDTKENVETVVSAMDVISSLRGVKFNYKKEEGADANSSRSAVNQDSVLYSYGADNLDIARQMRAEEDRQRIGLIAQEVETVLPEVVRTLPDGHKGIMYSDLVGILVEGLKDLSTQVETLQQEIAELKGTDKKDNRKAAPNENKQKVEAYLYQNTPNPFNQTTEIAYRLSDACTDASLCIYNLNGQQLKSYQLPTNAHSDKITVSASELTPGMYIYALLIDGQMIDSKRMVLTD